MVAPLLRPRKAFLLFSWVLGRELFSAGKEKNKEIFNKREYRGIRDYSQIAR